MAKHPVPGAKACAIIELCRSGGRYGLATMCIGVEQRIATIIEAI